MGDLYSDAFSEAEPRPVPQPQHDGQHVFYRVHFRDPRCFDDGDWQHDLWWEDGTEEFEDITDAGARRTAFAKHDGREEYCTSHPPKRRRVVTKIERIHRCEDRVYNVTGS